MKRFGPGCHLRFGAKDRCEASSKSLQAESAAVGVSFLPIFVLTRKQSTCRDHSLLSAVRSRSSHLRQTSVSRSTSENSSCSPESRLPCREMTTISGWDLISSITRSNSPRNSGLLGFGTSWVEGNLLSWRPACASPLFMSAEDLGNPASLPSPWKGEGNRFHGCCSFRLSRETQALFCTSCSRSRLL